MYTGQTIYKQNFEPKPAAASPGNQPIICSEHPTMPAAVSQTCRKSGCYLYQLIQEQTVTLVTIDLKGPGLD